MSTDPHRPTSAGAELDEVAEAPFAAPVDQPTEVHDTSGTDVTGTPEADPAPPATDWLATGAADGPDPVVATPSGFTPPGTPESDGAVAQATAVAERPEVQVGLAFLGGAVLSLLLKRVGR